jgi:hypothetical protein
MDSNRGTVAPSPHVGAPSFSPVQMGTHPCGAPEPPLTHGRRAQVLLAIRRPPPGPSLPAPLHGTTKPDRPPAFPVAPHFKRDRAPPAPPLHHPFSNQAHGRWHLIPVDLLSELAVGPLFAPPDLELPTSPLPPPR